MEKKLSEMNLEELWQLFPIVLAEHRACVWIAAELSLCRALQSEIML